MDGTTFISLAPSMFSEAGHDFAYHISVGEAVRAIGWNHHVFVPKRCACTNLPPTWKKSLLLWPLVRGELRENKGNTLFFIESFSTSVFLALAIVMICLARRNTGLLILFRYTPRHYKLGAVLIKVAQVCLRWRLKNRLHLLTDSELLKPLLSSYFQQFVQIMPIPHVETVFPEPLPKKPGEIVLWWPGAPRPSKGLAVIQQLAAYNSPAPLRGAPPTNDLTPLSSPLNLRGESKGGYIIGGQRGSYDARLVIAASTPLPKEGGSLKIERIADPLPRSFYLQWLVTSDVILLPYDPAVYGEGTSGIFVEAVVAGKIPVVTPGTWMAFELKRFGLDELIIQDWTDSNIIVRLISYQRNAEILSRLKLMQEAYRKKHGVSAFASAVMTF